MSKMGHFRGSILGVIFGPFLGPVLDRFGSILRGQNSPNQEDRGPGLTNSHCGKFPGSRSGPYRLQTLYRSHGFGVWDLSETEYPKWVISTISETRFLDQFWINFGVQNRYPKSGHFEGPKWGIWGPYIQDPELRASMGSGTGYPGMGQRGISRDMGYPGVPS